MTYRVKIKYMALGISQWKLVDDVVFATGDDALKWVMNNTDYYFLEYRILDNKGNLIYEVVNNKNGELGI